MSTSHRRKSISRIRSELDPLLRIILCECLNRKRGDQIHNTSFKTQCEPNWGIRVGWPDVQQKAGQSGDSLHSLLSGFSSHGLHMNVLHICNKFCIGHSICMEMPKLHILKTTCWWSVQLASLMTVIFAIKFYHCISVGYSEAPDFCYGFEGQL